MAPTIRLIGTQINRNSIRSDLCHHHVQEPRPKPAVRWNRPDQTAQTRPQTIVCQGPPAKTYNGPNHSKNKECGPIKADSPKRAEPCEKIITAGNVERIGNLGPLSWPNARADLFSEMAHAKDYDAVITEPKQFQKIIRARIAMALLQCHGFFWRILADIGGQLQKSVSSRSLYFTGLLAHLGRIRKLPTK